MPWTRGAAGKIRRAGGQAKLISGCFELSMKWKCCPTKEQSFHHSFAGYGSAAKLWKHSEPHWLLNFNFTGCQCNFVNQITEYRYQAVVICSDTDIALSPEGTAWTVPFCSLSLRNKDKKCSWVCYKYHKYLIFPAANEIIKVGLPQLQVFHWEFHSQAY